MSVCRFARARAKKKKKKKKQSNQSRSFNLSLSTSSLSLSASRKSKQAMSQLVQLVQGRFLLHDSSLYNRPIHALKLLPRRTCLFYESYTEYQRCQTLQSSLQESNAVIDSTGKGSIHSEARVWDEEESSDFPHVQTLRNFPMEELSGKFVMVRFDSTILLGERLDPNALLVDSALSTIKYLNHSGAKVLMISNWGRPNDSKRNLSTETVADHLSSVLQLKVVPANLNSVYTQSKAEEHEKADVLLLDNLSNFREESANCSVFAEKLSSGVDIFVNDSFSQSHKILASTIGVSRYCYASVAGFCFEKQLAEVKEITRTTKQPYFAIIGGGNLFDKATALQFLASKCDGLVFVGMMAFQLMHGLGLPVPLSFVEHCAVEHALKIIQLARERNIPVLLPKDVWCTNDCLPKELRVFPAHGISDGWVPVDLGPISLYEISSSLSNCKKILWIGPVKFKLPGHGNHGASKLATVVETLSRSGCDVTVVGNAACKAIAETSNSLSSYSLYENASVVWEFLKRRTLPGLAALDRAYPFEINWDTIFNDPAQPLVVDVGSGNGLFIFGMARRQKHLNFLGLENNKKLVKRCLDSVHQSGITNEYFIATNATSTFRSIISSYPGELVLVSILCPNPDFNRPEHRWRMLQRSLVEAIADLLTTDGKVFFQSDVEAVALRMKDQFLRYSKGKLAIINNNGELKTDSEGWLKENPYGIRSDWEQHVIDRGAPMYRLMISKVHQC